MNQNEMGAGTIPIVPIELPMTQPRPDGCGCSWGVDPVLRVKYIRYLYRDCRVLAHRIAFGDSAVLTPIIVTKEEVKKYRGQRGKDKAPRERKEPA